ncbi:MAG: 3',5'-cyclic-nucleotide phosphodiesterase [Rhodoferax sp.]|nr:3',5'-cyclic-nucleotide phosphodiesterase [Rhodoferax sp.]
MKVRVLGCSGAIAKDCRSTAFLIDQDVLLDAGTGVGDLTIDEMLRINHVLLTHSHLDHVAALPLMLDAVGALRQTPLTVYALAETIAALTAHVFNNLIWPDFTRLPTPENPFVRFQAIHTGQTLQLAGRQIEVLPAIHTVPAVGYAISAGQGCFVFSGDTGHNPALWQRLNQLHVAMLVIETAFSNREQALARLSNHLSPASLAKELGCIATHHPYPIYITHTKPAESGQILLEIQHLSQTRPVGHPLAHTAPVQHAIRPLQAGQEFEL